MPGVKEDAPDPIGADEAAALFTPLKSYQHLALAVSGGSDSIALMWLLVKWREGLSTPPVLSVLSVDHGLRDGSFAETERVGLWARALGLEHHGICWRGPKPQSGVQAAARAARYALMTSWCRTHHADALVLAHHLDDQAETVLMRLMKGSGIDGLCGMRCSSWREGVRLLRPLLDIPKARLGATLRQAGQDWLEDPSNKDMKYERVRIRSVLESLEDKGPGAEQLCNSARSLARTRDALDAVADALVVRAVNVSPGGFVHMDEAAMCQAAQETGLRVLRRALMAVGGAQHPPGRDKLKRIFEQVAGGGFAGATLCGCAIFRRAGRIWVVRELRGGSLGRMELAPGRECVWDNRFIVAAPKGGGTPYQVQMLGARGYQLLKGLQPDLEPLPVPAGQSLVSLWRGAELVSVPFARFSAGGKKGGFRADFFQKQRMLLTC